MVGYKETGYLLLRPEEGKIYESRDVRFNENLVFGNKYKKTEISDWETVSSEINPNTWVVECDNEIQTIETEGECKRGRGRPRKLKKNITQETGVNDKTTHVLLAEANGDPVNYQEAMKATDRLKWTESIKEEIESMSKNKVWKLVDRNTVPSDGKRQNIIDSKWVLKKKIDSDGNLKYKARLVIRGFKDKNKHDLQEIYAPVSHLPLIRMTLAITNKYDLELCQMDVKTAFLNGYLNVPVYMEIPDGIDSATELKREKICKLEKALYGLKVSPKCWNDKFTETVKKFGLQPDYNEPCLFTWREGNKFLILILYVDDKLLACNDREKMQEMKQNLNRSFEMTDIGEPKCFLGLEIKRDRKARVLKITREKYILKMITKFGFKDMYPQRTPMITN